MAARCGAGRAAPRASQVSRTGRCAARCLPLAALLLAGAAGAPAAATTAVLDLTPEGKRVALLFEEWRLAEGQQALRALARTRPGTQEVMVLEGYERYLSGDYPAAGAKLKTALAERESLAVKALLGLAEAAEAATRGHAERRSQHFVLRFPPEDTVLADYAIETLEAALTALRADLGFVPQSPIPVDIYRSPTDLASVSTLSVDEVERTGTIALCKWLRLMATTPRALRTGYPWQDSLAHELVHFAVSSLSRDRVPVWLHEGLAKFLERRWRAPAGLDLPPSTQHLLARALTSGKLITFEAMHPSMAKLPRAEDATLAFGEVASAVATLHSRAGMPGLRAAIEAARDGTDAREAVARAQGTTWREFERNWRQFMTAQKFRTIAGLDPVERKFRKGAALASRRAPSEDEAIAGTDPGARFLRLGNMMLLRGRVQAATIEYEKGAKIEGPRQWLFPVKLGRTYLTLGQPDRALAAVSEAQKLYPELPWPHLIAGQAFLARNEPARAIAPLLASIATNPFDPAVHCSLADAYARLPALAPASPGDGGPPPDGLDQRAERRDRAQRACAELRQ